MANMTRKEWVHCHKPELICPSVHGGVFGCPTDVAMKDMPGWRPNMECPQKLINRFGGHGPDCEKCWNTPLPEAKRDDTAYGLARASLLGAQKLNPTQFVKVETESVRKSILTEAANIVCNDRNKQYGEPEDNFATIASLWNPYLSAKLGQEVKLDGADVGMLMTLFKCGRIVSGQAKRDNFVDAAGYIACAGEIALKEEDK